VKLHYDAAVKLHYDAAVKLGNQQIFHLNKLLGKDFVA